MSPSAIEITTNSKKESDTCAFCGCPEYAGHSSNCEIDQFNEGYKTVFQSLSYLSKLEERKEYEEIGVNDYAAERRKLLSIINRAWEKLDSKNKDELVEWLASYNSNPANILALFEAVDSEVNFPNRDAFADFMDNLSDQVKTPDDLQKYIEIINTLSLFENLRVAGEEVDEDKIKKLVDGFVKKEKIMPALALLKLSGTDYEIDEKPVERLIEDDFQQFKDHYVLFTPLNVNILEKMLELDEDRKIDRYADFVLTHPELFQKFNPDDIVRILSNLKTDIIAQEKLRLWFLEKAESYTPELLEKLAFGDPNYKDFNLIDEVAQYIPHAQGRFTRQQGILFITHGQYSAVKANITKFENLTLDRELCLELINDYGGREVILENFHDFQGIDKEIISEMINKNPELVIESWDEILHFDLDNKLFDKLYTKNKTLLMDNLSKFRDLGNDQFIRILKDSWYCDSAVSNFGCFKLNVNNELKQQIQELIDNNQDDLKYSLALAKVGQLLFPDKTLEGKLKEISRTSGREQKKQALVEFKKFLSEYLKNWSEITSFIITILRTQPDISEEKFLSQVVTEMRKRKLEPFPFQAKRNENFIVSSLEYVEVKFVFRLIKEKKEKTNKLRASYPKDEDLFEYLYGRKPNGKVKFEETLGSFYIICEDPSDYALVYADINLEDDPEAESKIPPQVKDEIAITSGVCSYSNKMKCWVMVQKGGKGASIRRRTFIHESNHLLRKYVLKILRQPARPIISDSGSKVKVIDLLKREPAVEQARVEVTIRSLLRDRFEKVLDRAADEIIAFSNRLQTEGPEYIIKVLVEDPLYDYFREWKKDWRYCITKIIGVDKEDLKESGELSPNDYRDLHYATRKVVKYYIKEYKQLVTEAVKAYYKMAKILGDPQLAQGLLIKIPLNQWPKIVRRIEFNLASR